MWFNAGDKNKMKVSLCSSEPREKKLKKSDEGKDPVPMMQSSTSSAVGTPQDQGGQGDKDIVIPPEPTAAGTAQSSSSSSAPARISGTESGVPAIPPMPARPVPLPPEVKTEVKTEVKS